MDFKYLYLSTAGRISRKTWWLGVIGLFIIALILGLVIGLIGGVTGLAGSAFGLGLLSLISTAIVIYPSYCLSMKRLHDRGRPEVLALIFIAPSLATPVLQMLGLTGSVSTIEVFGIEAEAYQANAFGQLVSAVTLLVGLWALFELGIMKGQSGPNEHGADPLGSP